MLRIIRTRTLNQFDRSITELHDRASVEKTRADNAEQRIRQTVQLLDELDIPHNDALRRALKADQDSRHDDVFATTPEDNAQNN